MRRCMTNIINRDFISDNFTFTDLCANNQTYNKLQLVERINYWKYVLRFNYSAQPQESILIGMQKLGIDYFAIIIASAELSLKIVVVDYNRTDEFIDIEYNDPKTKLLSPIDIFLHDFPIELLETDQGYSKYVFFTAHSNRAYSTVDAFNFVIEQTLVD